MTERSSLSIRNIVVDVATVLVAIAAVAMAGSVAWDRMTGHGPLGSVSPREDRHIHDWERYALAGNRTGANEAAMVIIAFIDYECPFCRLMDETITALRRSYPEDVAVVYRHFPLPSHRNAYRAARLAECGAEQGYFEPVHRALYQAIGSGTLDATALAEAAEIPDPQAFTECATREGPVSRIEEDLALVADWGLSATPTIVVDGTLLGTPPDSAALFNLVRARLAETDRPYSVGDSASVRIISHSRSYPAPRNVRRVDPSPVAVIGVLDGPDEYVLPNVVAATVLSDETLVLTLFRPGIFELRYYDREGTHLASAGRFGDGPFEVGQGGPRGTLRLAGDSLLTLGADNRFSVFGPRGEHVRTGRLTLSVPYIESRGMDVPRMLMRTSGGVEQRADGWRRGIARYVLYETDSETVDALVDVPGSIYWHEEDGSVFDNAFSPDVYSAAGADWLWIGTSEVDEVRRYSWSGNLTMILRFGHKPNRVTRRDWKRYQETDLSGASEAGRRVIERRHHLMEIPETTPFYQGIRVDDDGHLWVLRYEPRYSEEDQVWERYSADGRWLGTVVVPFEILSQGRCARARRDTPCETIFEVDERYVLIRHFDDLNVQRIKKYTIPLSG